VIAAYGSFLAYAVLVRQPQVWKSALVATLALIVIAISGYLVPIATPDHIAHLVQTNFPQSEQYPSDWMQVHAGELDQLAQISIDAAKKTPGLIVWPEVPAPFSMQDPSFASRMVRIAKESGNEFLVGVVDWQKNLDWQKNVSRSLAFSPTIFPTSRLASNTRYATPTGPSARSSATKRSFPTRFAASQPTAPSFSSISRTMAGSAAAPPPRST
jgi:hypothetical protein